MDKPVIGVIIGNVNCAQMREILQGVQMAAKKEDVNLMFFLGVHMAPSFAEYFDNAVNYEYDYQYNVTYDYARLSGVDGLLIVYGTISMFYKNVEKAGFLSKFRSVPYVVLKDRDETGYGSSMISQNYSGMRRMMEHLINVHKYTKFLYLSGPRNNMDAEERIQAFRDVLDEKGIYYDDTMIEYGDFTTRVEMEINHLLNAHPDAQVLVCASDTMAEVAYRECEKRGIAVGTDLAITGYDDIPEASRMNPPLTTITQSDFESGYLALLEILNLINTNVARDTFISTSVKIRCSCGCKISSNYNFPKTTKFKQAFVENLCKTIVNKSVVSSASNDIKEKCMQMVKPVVKDLVIAMENVEECDIDREVVMNNLKTMVDSEYSKYISVQDLAEVVEAFVFEKIKVENDKKRIISFFSILNTINNFTRNEMTSRDLCDMERYYTNSVFVPYISSDMLLHIDNIKNFYKSALSMIYSMGIDNAYMFVFDEPIKHIENDEWVLPEKLYLAAFENEGIVISYEEDKRPVLDMELLLRDYIEAEDRYTMSIFSVFNGSYQYGFLAAETDLDDILLMNLVSLQISSAISFREMYLRQQRLSNELGEALEQVKEKNRILGFVSEYDQLTGCYNRRGFAEKAQEIFTNNQGSKAVMIIGDLDHLKEINDTFGHGAGDFAIKNAAGILKDSLGEDMPVARIGGDEFLAVYVNRNQEAEDISVDELRNIIKNKDTEFNDACDKPYFVNISLGMYEFICERNITIQELMEKADKDLYVAKVSRRKTIQKALQ